jgi:hypothetical protein
VDAGALGHLTSIIGTEPAATAEAKPRATPGGGRLRDTARRDTTGLAGMSGQPSLAIDCTQLHYGAWPGPIAWASVTDIQAADQTFRGKVLTFQVATAAGTEKRTVPVKKLADGDEAVLAAVSRYYSRYRNAAQYQRQAAAS